MKEVLSPVNGSARVKKVMQFDAAELVNNYQNLFNLDVRRYFNGIDNISLYECEDSGLQFFYPDTVVGDGKFYESIQHFDWYYVDNKWEFRQGLDLIPENSKVLEIGSGRGQFLKLLQQKTAHAEGLELNEKAIEEIRANGLQVHLMKIDEMEQQPGKKEYYDVVCSFQVYEHIENIGEVIRSSLNVLKPGGRLIISVPNSDCIYNHPSINPFNMPPHHQGLWYAETFRKLQQAFPLKLKEVFYEPTSFFNKFRAANVDRQIKSKQGQAAPLQYFKSLAHILSDPKLQRGRTMLAWYEKTK